MTSEVEEGASWPRARRLRIAATITGVLWGATAGSFVVLQGMRVDDRLLEALGVVASGLAVASVSSLAAAQRREWRELARTAARRDVIAASRPPGRVRPMRDPATIARSGPAQKRERATSRPPAAPPR